MESYHHFGDGDTHLPPGFRFHPTDEELITYYLLKKVLDRNFTGTLPPELGQLVYLEELYVNSCGLGGEIPSTFVNLQRMTTFWASDAAFTGNIPDFIGNWTGLTSLRFQGNSFEGPIPSSFSNLTSLTSLLLSEIALKLITLSAWKKMIISWRVKFPGAAIGILASFARRLQHSIAYVVQMLYAGAASLVLI